MDRGAWWARVHRVAKSWTRLKRFSTHMKNLWVVNIRRVGEGEALRQVMEPPCLAYLFHLNVHPYLLSHPFMINQKSSKKKGEVHLSLTYCLINTKC